MAYSKVILNGVTLMDVTQKTVEANKMLSGITALKNDGTDITGSVSSKAAATYTPTTSSQTIAAGQYLSGAQTISGDANLLAENIKKDVAIFGVTGTYEGGGVNNVTITFVQQSGIVEIMYYPNNATVEDDPDEPWNHYITLPENSLLCGRGGQPLNPAVSNLTVTRVQMGGRSPFEYLYVFNVGTTNGSIIG